MNENHGKFELDKVYYDPIGDDGVIKLIYRGHSIEPKCILFEELTDKKFYDTFNIKGFALLAPFYTASSFMSEEDYNQFLTKERAK